MSYTITEKQEIQILEVDDLWNPMDNKNLLSEIESLIESGKVNYVVDLAEMPFMNSSGLAFLISILTRARSAGGEVVIANISDKIQQILLISRLQDMFTTTNSVEEALEHLEGEATI